MQHIGATWSKYPKLAQYGFELLGIFFNKIFSSAIISNKFKAAYWNITLSIMYFTTYRLWGNHLVIIFWRSSLTCSTWHWVDTAATVQPNWKPKLSKENKKNHRDWVDAPQCKDVKLICNREEEWRHACAMRIGATVPAQCAIVVKRRRQQPQQQQPPQLHHQQTPHHPARLSLQHLLHQDLEWPMVHH